jgi:pSer/pThr/pTyr-binding forkhead associated (FHA) protein
MNGDAAMTPPAGVIEILDRSGRVRQRAAFRGGRLGIGRAYDNDVILDDPYVCAHHLVVREQDGEVVLQDLGSVNGTYLAGRSERLSQVILDGSNSVFFGHSQLRFRPADTAVEATWRDSSRQGMLAWFDKPLFWPAAVLAALAALTADSLQEMAWNPGAGELASEMIYPVVGVFLWSASWSLLNRLVSHRANLTTHLAIACTGVTALFLAGEAVALACFAFGLDRLLTGALLLVRVMVVAVTVRAHLRYATHDRGRLQWAAAVLSGLLLFGAPAIDDYLDRSEFDTIPYLEPLLKPPEFQLEPGVSPERFFRDSEPLKARLEED